MPKKAERATSRIMVKPSLWARIGKLRGPGETLGDVVERSFPALCECGAPMKYREETKDYACTACPHTVPLSDLTPMQPVVKEVL